MQLGCLRLRLRRRRRLPGLRSLRDRLERIGRLCRRLLLRLLLRRLGGLLRWRSRLLSGQRNETGCAEKGRPKHTFPRCVLTTTLVHGSQFLSGIARSVLTD